MRTRTYNPEQLSFAYSYRLYFRWHTHRRDTSLPLDRLDRDSLASQLDAYNIRLLELSAKDSALMSLVSLKPDETASCAASKIKGRVSKALREQTQPDDEAKPLDRGYFVCTMGENTGNDVDGYLAKQGEHHGYNERPLPPVYSEACTDSADDPARLHTTHSMALLRFHTCLATHGRQGVFGSEEGRMVAAAWREMQADQRFGLLKVSFVPDHVHLAVQVHPEVSPAELVSNLMTRAEQTAGQQFPELLIQAGIPQLWQPSAYIGSYGTLRSTAVKSYMEKWQQRK